MTYRYPKLLSIAGSDSGGGAGIQADLKTFTVLGCYGMTAITALTAQNTLGVQGILPVEADFVGRQLDSIYTDIGTDAVKIGMLHNSEVIRMVHRKLVRYGAGNIVLDPVMVSTSGDLLLEDEAIVTLVSQLIPASFLVTPNRREAEVITGRSIETAGDMEDAARMIGETGAANVLVKGGDAASDQASDCLLLDAGGGKEIVWFTGERIRTPNTHGTGCTLSSAIACFLARGFDIRSSVFRAKEFLSTAIERNAEHSPGHGGGPVDHLWPLGFGEKEAAQ